MLRRGYGEGFTTGTIAAGGTLKSLIPPSIVMILYCIVARTFIFDLFLAAQNLFDKTYLVGRAGIDTIGQPRFVHGGVRGNFGG